MHNLLKKLMILLTAMVLSVTMTTTALASGTVTYDGDAQKFIFAPGSKYSPTDLFSEFKGVMPGDSILENIEVHNKANNRAIVKIYMRALGAHPDSEEFLSQLKLYVSQESDTVLFDATASETAQLIDWVCLGTLYSGGQTELNVLLEVPVTLDNQFKNQIGYLDWEFMIEEYPIEPSDPIRPTGDETPVALYAAIAVTSAAAVAVLILLLQKKEKKTENA